MPAAYLLFLCISFYSINEIVVQVVGCASNNNNMPSKARTTRGPETDAPFIEVSCQKEREHNIQPGIAGKLEREREREHVGEAADAKAWAHMFFATSGFRFTERPKMKRIQKPNEDHSRLALTLYNYP